MEEFSRIPIFYLFIDVNIALGKVAKQSSTNSGRGFGAEKAVDGKLNTWSYTNTAISWWSVDLGKSAIIYKV